MLRFVQLIRLIVRFIIVRFIFVERVVVRFAVVQRQFIWLEQRLVIEFLGLIVRLVFIDRQQLVR
jgi:hypothetical protein